MYRFTSTLMEWSDKSVSLVERIINEKTGKKNLEKETDVIVYKHCGKKAYYVKAEPIEKTENESELTV